MPTFFTSQNLFRNLSLMGVTLFVLSAPVYADEVATRNGLEPADQSKVTRVLARERLRSNSSANAGSAGGGGAAKAGKPQDCTTNIGNINTRESRPGVRPPKENITVIKAPVVNKC